jgi:predicted GNAT family N-acyltransferase
VRETITEIQNGSPLLAAAFELRRAVFVVEQGVPEEIEIDELDQSATHLVALVGAEVVGTLRILSHEGEAKIGRVAVRAQARRGGMGARLMEHAETIVRGRGFGEIVLHAQISVAEFYRRLGYVEEGEPFDEAGIPHVAMRKRIVR